MRNQFLSDPIEHLDFHVRLNINCLQIEDLILNNSYTPGPTRRILIEKSKGLCRQLVIPNVCDALVLQCLSDALYHDIRGQAPSRRSYFEPDDHTFSNAHRLMFAEPTYGTFRAWLNFQKALFQFPKVNRFVIATDIANYYDFISYSHLRNIISGTIRVRESVLDMLLFVLSGLLWQPDYMPRVEIGLPQINIDAPRILAHCFLYELDKFLEQETKGNFVRYMDDIDFGVDNIDEGRRLLKEIDLVLHTRQVRLNPGKTLIMTHEQAARHFRIRDNRGLDLAASSINRKLGAGRQIDRERRYLRAFLRTNYRRRQFDDGNGEKILKRSINMHRRIELTIPNKMLHEIIRKRPGVRSSVFSYIGSRNLTPVLVKLVCDYLRSGSVIDDVAYIEGVNSLVDGQAISRPFVHTSVMQLANYLRGQGFYGLYAAIWVLSKYGTDHIVVDYLRDSKPHWQSDHWLGRLVGGLRPLFWKSSMEDEFCKLVGDSKNASAMDVSDFHEGLKSDVAAVNAVQKILHARNEGKKLGITHAKFLMLLSVLANDTLPDVRRRRFIVAHAGAWKDIFYRSTARRVVESAALRSLIA